MEDDTAVPPLLSSSSSVRARDDVFCHETARRAVARAALHLGIDSMSVEASDTLAAILLAYLGRIGQAISITVEASGRSSAHSNLLDALRAIEICTEPAVTGLFPDNASAPQALEASQSDSDRYSHDEQISWKGLAAFCFGKQWREPLESSATNGNVVANPMNRSRGGKGIGGSNDDQTTSLVNGDEGNTEGNTAASTSAQTGWRAPYPEEVIPFPVASQEVANPHNLPEDLLEAEEVPENVFAINGERKRPREDEKDQEPPSKKAKTDEDASTTTPATTNTPESKPPPHNKDAMEISPVPNAAAAAAAASSDDSPDDDEKHRPWHFPKHWPSYPSKKMGTQAVVSDYPNPLGVADEELEDILGGMEGRPSTGASKAAEAESDPTRSVRSALVQMGWGTMRESIGVPDPYDLRVVAGAKLDAAGGGAKPQIVPLGKASISRVNRILEGSME